MHTELEARSVAAAHAVASDHGLTSADSVVLSSRSNVLVHLRPAPVVARVMTGTIALHDDPWRWLAREVAVLRFLAPTGLAVAPSPLIPPGPHNHDGLWLTFVEWLPVTQGRSAPEDPARLGASLKALHATLQGFDGELADMHDLRTDIARLHARLTPANDDEAARVSALGTRLAALDDVFASPHPTQALHGDVSLSNRLHTGDGGFVWNDFEDVLRGPLHWDVASIAMDLRERGGDARAMLDAYGWGNERELEPFFSAHTLYGNIWQMYDRQRRRSPPA